MAKSIKVWSLALVGIMLVLGVSMIKAALPVEFYLENADFTVIGEENGDWTAYFASPAGDVNGDGLGDFLVGAPMAGNKVCPYPNPDDCDGLPKGEGRAYLVLGKPQSEWPASPMNLLYADAAFLGCEVNSMTARQLYTAGDVNGDGYDDMLISGWKCGPLYEGKAYLVLGKPEADWGRDYDLENGADASFMGEYEWDMASYYTATAGDVNGDGLDDMLVSVTHNDEGGENAGQVYLILGREDADWGRDYSLADADASFIGEAVEDRIGRAVVGIGDINSDGFGDFMIGSVSSDDGAIDAGETYLFLGRASADWGMDMPISQADASFVGEGEGDESGRRMAGVGDVNGDGYDDFIIGASKNDDNGFDSGKTYLFLGRENIDWGEDHSLGLADAIFVGEARRDQSGRRVSGAGDPNHDGYDDFLIGAPHSSRNGELSGVAYLIYGRPEADWGTDFSLSYADVTYLGKPEIGVAGYDVAWVGDFDGDTVDDFLIAAYGGRNNESIPGEAYLILGNDLPEIEISQPLDGYVTPPWSPVSFVGWAFDETDGDLTSSMVWTSDIDGVIGFGGSFSTSLSEGEHLITAAATDSGGFTVKAQVEISVVTNATPEVTIISPLDRSIYAFNRPIKFFGEALDFEDGDISNQILWLSPIDGQIGIGREFQLVGLNPGIHEITASATDSGGLTSTATIKIIVRENEAPQVIEFNTEFSEGAVFTWQKFITLIADKNGAMDIKKGQVVLEAGQGDPLNLNVTFFLDMNEIYLRNSAGDGWIGPCSPGDAIILSNGYVELDCKRSLPIYYGDYFIKLRVLARWVENIDAAKPLDIWLNASDQYGNSFGFVDFGSWVLLP